MKEFGRRIASMINRAVLSRLDVSSKNPLAIVKGVWQQDKEVEIFQTYGLTTGAVEGAELLRFCLEGYEDHSVALGFTGGLHRPTDANPGEVIVYSQLDNEMHRIKLADNGDIELATGTSRLTLSRDALTIRIGDNQITIDSNGMSSNKDGVFQSVSVKNHTHGGVDTGPGNTAPPN